MRSYRNLAWNWVAETWDRELRMKWRFVLELVGAGPFAPKSSIAAVPRFGIYAPGDWADAGGGKRMLSAAEYLLVRAQPVDHCNLRRRCCAAELLMVILHGGCWVTGFL
jgi:hypothetical protein